MSHPYGRLLAIPIANTKRQAEGAEKNGAAVTEGAAKLLAKAESTRPEQFSKEATASTSHNPTTLRKHRERSQA